MFAIKFSSMTYAGKAFSVLRSQGISSKIEKGTSSGCAFKILISPQDKNRALNALRQNSVPFSLK